MAVSGNIKIGDQVAEFETLTALSTMMGEGWSVAKISRAIPKGTHSGVFNINGYEVAFNRNARGYGTGKMRTTYVSALVLHKDRATLVENVTVRELSVLTNIRISTIYNMLRVGFHERVVVMFDGVMVAYADDMKQNYRWPHVSREEIRKSFSERVCIGGKSVLREA